MIRNLLATTAIATLVATGAFAQTTTPGAPADPAAPGAATAPETPMVIKAEGHLASNIIGETVYNGAGDDAENIGEVKDLVLDPEGNIQAIVVGVGGFLGIGQKQVALEYNLVKWEERDNERFIVVETNREALEALEEFDAAAYEPQPADADVAETKPATAEDLAAAQTQAGEAEEGEATDDMAAAPEEEPATDETAAAPEEEPATDETAAAPEEEPATDDMAAAPADGDAAATDEQETAAAPEEEPATDDMAAAPADGDAAATDEQETAQAPADEQADTDEMQTGAIDRSQLKERPLDQIRSEDLVGTTVYGANDEQVGEIGDVILSQDGQVDAVLVDVGGFLGMGEKEVALGMDNLQFMADEDGDLYLYTNLTKEQLESQPAYDEASYAENRDEMRMDVPATE